MYPTAVGSYWPNPFGLYDLHGNVLEWAEDCYHEDYEDAPSDGRAWTGCDIEWAVLRGGAWAVVSRDLRSASGAGHRIAPAMAASGLSRI